MMANASDIITYVGVPLAVIGVVPTLYIAFQSVATSREIRELLLRNGVTALIRSSLLSGIVEVEIQRLNLQPLDRDDPDYFEVAPRSSSLKGGSWTKLNWRTLSIGRRVYRLQYHDELVQPQAEADFENLVAFLLDRGAVPDERGFADLRSSGLWTPAGTRLLVSPDGLHPVLSVASSEDSEGLLSLAMDWRPHWDKRTPYDLPPYWMRIHAPEQRSQLGILDEKKRLSGAEVVLTEKVEVQQHRKSLAPADIRLSTNTETMSITYSIAPSNFSSALRLHMGQAGVDEMIFEDNPKRKIRPRHLRQIHGEPNTMAMWFSCAATALGAPKGGLWSYSIPESIVALSAQESVPCGIMVLLGVMAEGAVPTWRSTVDVDDQLQKLEERERQNQRHRQMMEDMRLGTQLTPEQRTQRQLARMREDMDRQRFEGERKRIEEERKRSAELVEALNSPRLGAAKVAAAMVAWLVERGHVSEGATTVEVVERVLWEMVNDREVAAEIGRVMDAWRHWGEEGGMTKGQYETVKESLVTFGYASCILALIHEVGGDLSGTVVSDLQDCLRLWRRVRLG
jgi:hypothetical protein